MSPLLALALLSCLTVTEGFGSSAKVEEEAVPPPSAGGPVDCSIAEPQSPRDVSAGYQGGRQAHMVPLGNEQVEKLVHVNTHYHLGAEHRSEGEYDQYMEMEVGHMYHWDEHEDEGIDRRRRLLESQTTPGYFCKNMADGLTEEQKKPYEFQYCKNTEVGLTYEIHWVYSSGGQKLQPTLMGAFALQMNPAIIVQGQVYVLINDEAGEYDDFDLLHGKSFNQIEGDKVKYLGSTTGVKYNEEVCSPFLINWNVDRKCHLMSAQAMDKMCKMMIEEYDMEFDAEPHGSRAVVSVGLASSEMLPLE